MKPSASPSKFTNKEVNKNMDFVQVVKTKIKQNGFKQNFIADKIGLNTVSLTDRLTGKVKFKTDEVFKLAKILNINLNQFKEA